MHGRGNVRLLPGYKTAHESGGFPPNSRAVLLVPQQPLIINLSSNVAAEKTSYCSHSSSCSQSRPSVTPHYSKHRLKIQIPGLMSFHSLEVQYRFFMHFYSTSLRTSISMASRASRRSSSAAFCCISSSFSVSKAAIRSDILLGVSGESSPEPLKCDV